LRNYTVWNGWLAVWYALPIGFLALEPFTKIYTLNAAFSSARMAQLSYAASLVYDYATVIIHKSQIQSSREVLIICTTYLLGRPDKSYSYCKFTYQDGNQPIANYEIIIVVINVHDEVAC
jgi:hypothetical protein